MLWVSQQVVAIGRDVALEIRFVAEQTEAALDFPLDPQPAHALRERRFGAPGRKQQRGKGQKAEWAHGSQATVNAAHP